MKPKILKLQSGMDIRIKICAWHWLLLKAYLHAAICRPREIVKHTGACKWRPDACAISVRHVGRFGKNLIFRVGADFTAQAYVSFEKWRTLKINLLGKKGLLMKRRSTFLYHSGRNIPAFLTKLFPNTKTKTNGTLHAPICFTRSQGRQIGTTNSSV